MRKELLAWSLYDLGNTTFSLGIVSLYFPVYIFQTGKVTDGGYGMASSSALFVLLLFGSWIGGLADRFGWHKHLLIITTTLSILFTYLLGFLPPQLALIAFAFAHLFYHTALIFYDSYLGILTPEEKQTTLSGFGVSMGYVGSLLTIGIGSLTLSFAPSTEIGYRVLLIGIPTLFLLFSIPAFFYLPLTTPHPERKPTLGIPSILRKNKTLQIYFFTRILYGEVVSTVIVYMGIYAVEEGGFTPHTINLLMLLSIFSSIFGGFFWGKNGKKIGLKFSLSTVLYCWILSLLLGGIAGITKIPFLFYLTGIAVGFSLGGTWTIDRPLLLSLAPSEHRGELFGIYTLTNRVGGTFGPLLWGVLVSLAGIPRPWVVLLFSLWIFFALYLLRFLPDPEVEKKTLSSIP
jgi:UMF1 family MFS transporter